MDGRRDVDRPRAGLSQGDIGAGEAAGDISRVKIAGAAADFDGVAGSGASESVAGEVHGAAALGEQGAAADGRGIVERANREISYTRADADDRLSAVAFGGEQVGGDR